MSKPEFDHWRKFGFIYAWELAAMLRGVDPRSMPDILMPNPDDPTDKIGIPLDLTDEIRMVNSAVDCGEIEALQGGADLYDGQARIKTRSLASWLTRIGHSPIAAGLCNAPGPAPATVVRAPSSRVLPSRKQRQDLLAPVIDRARKEARDPNSTSQVFNVLRDLARSPNRPSPLVGVTDSGIQWLDASDRQQELSHKNLSDRIHRANAR